ncbi:MAG: response regulator, partial [Spirochaetales bacterium]|nr:response regulator [Spirochaetales bacterium]
SNAIKYTRDGRISLKIVWAEMSQDEGLMTIRVSDTGQGIKKEDMDKLFSQYGQLNAQANRNIEGTGLGLSITRKLVEMMGGTIHAESAYGQGSVFTVTIRQRIVDPAPLGKEMVQDLRHFRFTENSGGHEANQVSVHIPTGKVLVVDDVETNLYVARGLLLLYGLHVDCAKSGQEAITRIREEEIPYDLVFMDHMMPDMDGVEAAGLIRAINTEYARSLPIIALTANAIVGMREMFLEKGFNDYLSKPISRSKLDEILIKWIHPEKQRTPETPAQLQETRLQMLNSYVLVVDDVVSNLKIARGLLEPYGLNIYLVKSGRQAIDLIRRGEIRFDAVFMDQVMPEMDGIEAARVIRNEIDLEYTKTMPIIAMTVNALDNEKEFLNRGFQDFLRKPVDTLKLDKVLRKWVARQ